MRTKIACWCGLLVLFSGAGWGVPWIPSGSISGHVHARDSGRPLAAVQVLLPEAGVEVRTDSDGAFRIALLPPGPYDIKVICKGYMSVQLRVIVRQGRPTAVDCKMLRARDVLEARRT
ncbi:MAG: carboxypeptidase regulatory-like domain-containing protein [Candidatus Latescibacterota bacterium]|nr:MAG: carboxypeptidase regulatory-like domain-containing protein [Candidatus Latescibacterota bacterium]